MDTKLIVKNKEDKEDKSMSKTLFSRVMGVVMGVATFVSVQTMTVQTASAEINETTFQPITNLIDAVIPLFTSILDLIIAVFPLVIAMAFLGGLAYLINKIFDGALNFDFKRRK